MKTAIISVLALYFVLELWVKNAENKSKRMKEEQQKERERIRKQKESWTRRYYK